MSPGRALLLSIAAGLVLIYALTAAGFIVGGASVADALREAAVSMVSDRGAK